MFLKQLDNLFGLDPLLKRQGNDGQPGLREERKRRKKGDEKEGETDEEGRWWWRGSAEARRGR